ncbi:hypothetical protein Sjap_023186 [Stephania japonica]|uniref:Uncharacterized protein n=1 Tax=Stephania japonica TaxID=461633 RepID=A0AAP0EJK1_9MAGN
MLFAKLDDSPMLRKQIQGLEESAESLRERSVKFYKGCRKYTEQLGEGYDGDIAFASALETFGGGHNDPIGVAFGGPVLTKFTIALREIGTYKEVLRSQEARKRFDKATLVYDQAREKFLSLRKSTRMDVANALEEITALSNVEAKKRFDYLEAVSGAMDAHLRYFKQGYELLRQMEPYFNQVLTYAQQSRERSNYEHAALAESMQEYKRKIDRESRWSANGQHGSPKGDGIQTIGRSSHKVIETVMQTAAKGKGAGGQLSDKRHNNSHEIGSGLLSRWLSSHHHGGVHDEKSVARHTVNLLTSTIKVDADQSDLRFCFRIISPAKNYTLQAENEMDQMDWIEKITGVIASLLSFQSLDQHLLGCPLGSGHHHSTSESSSFESSEFDHSAIEECTSERNPATGYHGRSSRNSQEQRVSVKIEKPIDLLRRVFGNEKCADCGAPDPDWASLNLGILDLCFQVRSLTLDVKVWEPSVIALFQSLGNAYANTIWEELLDSQSTFEADDFPPSLSKYDKQPLLAISKPSHTDPISAKEKYIHAKNFSSIVVNKNKVNNWGVHYACTSARPNQLENFLYSDKLFVYKPEDEQHYLSVAQEMWDNVRSNDKKALYRHIVTSEINVNAVNGPTSLCLSLTLARAMLRESSLDRNSGCSARNSLDGATSASSVNSVSTNKDRNPEECLEGCSLLHLACQTADLGMIELLLQYGADINAQDSRGRTPLHHCICRGRTLFAKLLLSRGGDPHAVDMEGKTPLQYAVDSNFNDTEVLSLLADTER